MKLSLRFLLIVSLLLVFFSFVGSAIAAEEETKPILAIRIGTSGTQLNFETVNCSEGGDCSIPWIGQYIAAIFKYGVGIAAILATIMIMIGGFVWLSSGGSPDKVGKAKEFITSAILGLFLALFSYLMLYTINPRLVASEPILVKNIAGISTGSDISIDDAMESSRANVACGTSAEACATCRPWSQGETDRPCELVDDSCSAPVMGTDGSGIVRYRIPCSAPTGSSQVNGPIATSLQTAAIGDRLNNYVNTYDAILTSGLRPGEPRHGSGYVVDMSYKSDSLLTSYVVMNKAQVQTLSWGTAYYMPDNTVFVKEADNQSQSGYHWHVEFQSPGWLFIPER